MKYNFLQYMYKMPKHIVENIHNEYELIETIKRYFISNYARNFIQYSQLSVNEWSKILPISKRTLQRVLEADEKKLEIKVSEPIVEFGEIYQIGLKAFDDNITRLNNWLNSENAYFNKKKPIEIMDTHKGRDLVRQELNRIEYSEFS